MIEKNTFNILQQNVRKFYTSMLKIFDDVDNFKYDIIVIQKSWRNSQYNAICNSMLDRFEMLYYNVKIIKTIFFVNKNITLTSWNVTHRRNDFFTLKLKINDVKIINIHNIYNSNFEIFKSNNSMILLKNILRQHQKKTHNIKKLQFTSCDVKKCWYSKKKRNRNVIENSWNTSYETIFHFENYYVFKKKRQQHYKFRFCYFFVDRKSHQM